MSGNNSAGEDIEANEFTTEGERKNLNTFKVSYESPSRFAIHKIPAFCGFAGRRGPDKGMNVNYGGITKSTVVGTGKMFGNRFSSKLFRNKHSRGGSEVVSHLGAGQNCNNKRPNRLWNEIEQGSLPAYLTTSIPG